MYGNMNSYYHEGNFPESWIELFNSSDDAVDLNGYRLGTSSSYDDAFRIKKASTIQPSDYWIVSCDKNSGNVEMKIDSDGGDLYLFDDSGAIVDYVSYKKMRKPDVSWGRDTSGSWGTMLRTTPGKENSSIADNKFPDNVEFSVDGGVWEHFDPFYVELTASDVPDYYSTQKDVDTTLCIRYTLDGSEPTYSSDIYTEPIYVKTSTVIRAKVFDATKPLLPSNGVSYIYHGRPVDKNVVSLITDSVYFYSEEEGLLSNNAYATNDYRRIMNFEYFSIDDDRNSLNLLCKGRAAGNSTRYDTPYLNLILYAKKEYGQKHFKTTFWPHLKPSVNENKSIYLRAGNKHSCFMRDAVCLNMASFLNIDYQATDALSVYMNGKYYGFLYMYERSNEDYVWSNYNKMEDIDLISIEGSQKGVVKAGTIDEFNLFRDFWQSAPHKLKEWRKWMDVDEYTDIMALELFVGNRDFWNNNTRLYKVRGDKSSVWRWIANDFDRSFSDFFDRSYFEWALKDDTTGFHKSTDYGSQLWNGLLQSEEYKSYFLDRIIAYHGDFLNKRQFCYCVDSIYQLAKREIELTQELYMEEVRADKFYEHLKKCITKRSNYFHTDLQTFFNLGKAVKVKVSDVHDNISLYYNNVKLKSNSFDGWDFADRRLSIQAKNDKYIEPLNWIVGKYQGDEIGFEQYSNEDMLTYLIPSDVDSLVFIPIDTLYEESDKKCPKKSITLTDLGEFLGSGNNITVWDIYGRQVYCSDEVRNLVISSKQPLFISVDGCVKKIMH